MSRASKPAIQLPLMIPYLVWVSYAAALNAKICIDNPSERLIKVGWAWAACSHRPV